MTYAQYCRQLLGQDVPTDYTPAMEEIVFYAVYQYCDKAAKVGPFDTPEAAEEYIRGLRSPECWSVDTEGR